MPQSAPEDDVALLRRLWRAALKHHVRNLEAAGDATAAELVAAQRFLADSGVSLATLGSLDMHNHGAGLKKLMEGIPSFDEPAGALW
ncbi:hypothetical protein [Solimonas variicoloris]|uniref:hypothetical protein n=1 Tax=Solimonas variicoloris TaxID=254408 RepID=UPI0012B5E4DD|nr:hypothetical protein [Solimonas variicoloris]